MTKGNSHTTKEVKICPDCKGFAKVEVFVSTDHSNGTITKTEECKRCEGSGRIVLTVTIKEEAFKDE